MRSKLAFLSAVIFIGTMAPTKSSPAASFYEDNPTYRDYVNDDSSWIVSTPASVGLSSTKLGQAATEFAKNKYSYSLLVIRHDTLAYEKYFHSSTKRSSNNIHSASKSILSAAVGVAISKGLLKLDQPIRDFLPLAPKDILVRHLLTMTAGFKWTEDKTEYEIEKARDWVQAILRLPIQNRPDEKFLYSTGNTHLLSAVLSKATGMTLAKFARANIFDKIGIAEERWGKDPQGISSGGYNLYMTPREMGKFGRLYLHGGTWKGVSVVPEAWVKEAIRPHVTARPGFGYGYNWWIRNFNGHQVSFAWGYGGQFIYLVPSLDMVVVMTTNTKGKDPNFDGDALMQKYILAAVKK